MPLALLALQLTAPDLTAPNLTVPDLVTLALARTAAETRCVYTDITDVTVCGRRAADRFRVPLSVVDPGDPAHEGVGAERRRLLHRTTPLQDMGPFLVGGGAAGVGVTMTAGHGTRVAGLRPPAP